MVLWMRLQHPQEDRLLTEERRSDSFAVAIPQFFLVERASQGSPQELPEN